MNHLDDLTGSIEVGKRADLAVLDRDVFAHPVDEIADASVVLTFVEGSACSMPNGRADVGSPLTSGHGGSLPGVGVGRTMAAVPTRAGRPTQREEVP